MRKLKSWRVLIRPGLLLAVAASLALVSKSLLWVPFALLAAFFVAVDLFRIDRSDRTKLDMEREFKEQKRGVLGEYIVDSTKSFGLFLVLLSKPVFVDIRRDELIEERKRQAIFLYENTDTLEKNLAEFLDKRVDYKTRQITYIGLHSRVIDQGEVFWEPEGYTKLSGLCFLPD